MSALYQVVCCFENARPNLCCTQPLHRCAVEQRNVQPAAKHSQRRCKCFTHLCSPMRTPQALHAALTRLIFATKVGRLATHARIAAANAAYAWITFGAEIVSHHTVDAVSREVTARRWCPSTTRAVKAAVCNSSFPIILQHNRFRNLASTIVPRTLLKTQ